MGTVRRVSRNVKYWRSPSMALRWAGAAMQEAAKGFKRLKAYKQLPLLQAALAVRKARTKRNPFSTASVSPRKARDEQMFSGMRPIAAGSEPCRHLRSAPFADTCQRR
jgi:hypothetical protein